jgi:hypothetical protein
MLKRRLERYDNMRARRKMRPNISNEWVNKLKEILKILSNNAAHSNINQRRNASSPPPQPAARISQSQRAGK